MSDEIQDPFAALADLDALLDQVEHVIEDDLRVPDYLREEVIELCAGTGVISVRTRNTAGNAPCVQVALGRQCTPEQLLDALFDAQGLVLRSMRGPTEDDVDDDE